MKTQQALFQEIKVFKEQPFASLMKKKPTFVNDNGPTKEKERFVILDALRGFALAGIVLANFPEFGLWTFLSAESQNAMPTASTDHVVRFLQYLFVDGKFYTIFSLLFGIGFSLILSHHPTRLFVRRMLILVAIGLCHLLFIWSGDILLLYATGGLLLPLFFKMSDKTQLWTAALLILLPVGLDTLTECGLVNFSQPLYDAWWSTAAAQGITEENFATWLRDADTYPAMFAFLLQGAVERMWEFVDGHRLPKVIGLFIIGSQIGKHHLYARLKKLPLRRLCMISFAVGLPVSVVYAWSSTQGHPLGQTVHSLLYATSVIPLAFGYITAICLLYTRRPTLGVFKCLAAPGRMALSNYIGQSLTGIVLFYGVGFGLGTSFGLVHIELTALLTFVVLAFLSWLWLRGFLFGPLEWLWRMLTYKRFFPIRRR